MMPARIFLTGATGYLGGEVLHQLASQPVKHTIRVLVRDATKAKLITTKYPSVQPVLADLDSTETIASEAQAADIALHLAATNHIISSRAIAEGLAARKTPGYWIQIAGASMFSTAEIAANRYGEHSEKVWDDMAVDEIEGVVEVDKGRVVNQLVMSQDPEKVKTALIPGPLFYGLGRGPGNTESIQAPGIVRESLKHGAWQVGLGQAAWSSCHVADLGALVVLLVNAAMDGKGQWGREGVYFPESEIMTFGEIAERVAQVGKASGKVKSLDVRQLSVNEVNEIMPHGAVLLGTNARLKGTRAREILGWKPTGSSLEEEIERLVKLEAEK